jgi:hypothetical protein
MPPHHAKETGNRQGAKGAKDPVYPLISQMG